MITKIKNHFGCVLNKKDFEYWEKCFTRKVSAIEHWAELKKSIDGYCDCCGKVVSLKIETGAMFLDVPNLREGFVCPRGLGNRQRLLYRLMAYILANQANTGEKVKLGLFEDLSPLSGALSELSNLDVRASNYLGESCISGNQYEFLGQQVVHQDMLASSYEDGSLDVVMHNDVLEHIPDTGKALAEQCRILKQGGIMVMTAPFFPSLQHTQQLARLNTNGEVEHLIDPPEYHGDPITGLILAYYRFGWSIMDDIKAAGFSDAVVVLEYDPFSGLTSNNNHNLGGNMPPIAIVALK
jgi:SAM-dependent methyltransferase